MPLDKGACAFLDRCADGANLERATQAALAANPDTDFSQLMYRLLAMGVIARIDQPDEIERTP